MKTTQVLRGLTAFTAAAFMFSNQIIADDFTSNLGVDGNIPTGIGFHLPGVKAAMINPATGYLEEDRENKAYITVGGQIVYEDYEESDFSGLRSTVTVKAGVQYGQLSAEAQLNLQKLVTEALEDDFEARGYTNFDGLAEVNAKAMLENAIISWVPIKFGADENIALRIDAGRGQVVPSAQFLMDTKVAISFLEGAKLDQVDHVAVSVVSTSWAIKLAAFGDSWLPYLDSDDRFDPAEAVNDEIDSFAISANARLGAIDAYVGYAMLESFANLNDPSFTSLTGNQFTAGALWNVSETFRVAGEVVHFAADEDDMSDVTNAQIRAEYDLLDRLTLAGGFEIRESDDDSVAGTRLSGSVAYRVAGNAAVVLEVSHIDREAGDSELVIGGKLAITGSEGTVLMLNERSTSSEANAQATVSEMKK